MKEVVLGLLGLGNIGGGVWDLIREFGAETAVRTGISLRVKKALVLGQAAPGIPVWKTGKESLFPGLSYVIFPGNVGGADTLRIIVETLC